MSKYNNKKPNIGFGLYYLYRHIRLDKNEPFYVGIGKKKKNRNYYESYETEYERAFSKFRPQHWKNINNKTEIIVEILYESNSLEEIRIKEIEFIKLYGRKDLELGSLINKTDGGEGIFNPSKETREKKCETQFKRGTLCQTKLTRKKISESSKGKKLSQTTKDKISQATLGKPRYKKVQQFSLDGKLIMEYPSIRQAVKNTNTSPGTIRNMINGKRRARSFEYIWKENV